MLSGLLLQGPGLALGLPLMLAGAIKVGYDLSLWAIFRHVPVEDTQEASIDPTEHTGASSKEKGNA